MSGMFSLEQKKLSEKNNLFSESEKKYNYFPILLKKMLSLPLCSTRVTRFVYNQLFFIFEEKSL